MYSLQLSQIDSQTNESSNEADFKKKFPMFESTYQLIISKVERSLTILKELESSKDCARPDSKSIYNDGARNLRVCKHHISKLEEETKTGQFIKHKNSKQLLDVKDRLESMKNALLICPGVVTADNAYSNMMSQISDSESDEEPIYVIGNDGQFRKIV